MALSKPSPLKGTEKKKTKKKKRKNPFSQMSVALGAGLIAYAEVLIFRLLSIINPQEWNRKEK